MSDEIQSNKKFSRRDFINGALVGAGAALMMGIPAAEMLRRSLGGSSLPGGKRCATPSSKDGFSQVLDYWSGPTGIGDYRIDTGDSASMPLAHKVRDGLAPRSRSSEPDEEYDYIIVGGGFAGISAAYNLLEETGGKASVLMLDVHPLPGGVAKLNEFNVDGHHLMAPQASDQTYVPNFIGRLAFHDSIWDDIGMPDADELLAYSKKVTGVNSRIKFSRDHYEGKYIKPKSSSVGTFFRNGRGGYTMARDIVRNEFKNTPFSPEEQRQLVRAYDWHAPLPYDGGDWKEHLDRMTFKEFLESTSGFSPRVTEFLSPMLAAAGGGLGPDAVSAYHGFAHAMPGTFGYVLRDSGGPFLAALDKRLELRDSLLQGFGFPGGNSMIYRKIFKRLLPDAISGCDNVADVLNGAFRPEEFDRAGNHFRFRSSSMVSSIVHQGKDSVDVSYFREGKAFRARARGVICATGAWIGKRILADAPTELLQAMASYTHAPMLTVNIAVRNWNFFANQGISSAQWFQGFGSWLNVRTPMRIGSYDEPAHPNLPAVLTMYISWEKPDSGLPAFTQVALGRQELLETPYMDLERRVIKQLDALFGPAGFQADRDIAAMVANRWGHDYCVAPPGFYFGKDGQPAPPDIIREGYGRVRIAHSELNGVQNWSGAVKEGRRAARQILSVTG